MKEIRYFYAPQLADGTLPGEQRVLTDEEAQHALRVLRLRKDDSIILTDGMGMIYHAIVVDTTSRTLTFTILSSQPVNKAWRGQIKIAVAPTKNIDRIEWFVEKATEIGVDDITFLCCQNSERRNINIERLNKIVVSAMKQSHKAYKPHLEKLTNFEQFIIKPFKGIKLIAHCYDQSDIEEKSKSSDQKTIDGGKPNLFQLINTPQDSLVMIGPEGDFSIDEVRLAIKNGFKSVSLGSERLRTETAALVATHIMRMRLQIQ